MSTYAYMRLLESVPYRYDTGIRWLSLGRVTRLYAAAADAAVAGLSSPRVLELGCGTGNLTLALRQRGATVLGIDHNPEMLAVAQQKLGTDGAVELREMAAVEIADRLPAGGFDVVAAALLFSELPADERRYLLRAVHRLLRPGGRLVIADEVRPERIWQRAVYRLLRWPVAVVTYLLTQTSTWAVADLKQLVAESGYHLQAETRWALGSMALVVAQRPEGVRE
ncbi:MAG: class I SAM-dependent methyltransferase [Deltaproteobacteria bacterium]|nr:class I SAM-dependent methyltransferase [Deltaproteobacteria bacterium]